MDLVWQPTGSSVTGCLSEDGAPAEPSTLYLALQTPVERTEKINYSKSKNKHTVKPLEMCKDVG